MAKLQSYTENTTPADNDIVHLEDFDGANYLTQKLKLSTLSAYVSGKIGGIKTVGTGGDYTTLEAALNSAYSYFFVISNVALGANATSITADKYFIGLQKSYIISFATFEINSTTAKNIYFENVTCSHGNTAGANGVIRSNLTLFMNNAIWDASAVGTTNKPIKVTSGSARCINTYFNAGATQSIFNISSTSDFKLINCTLNNSSSGATSQIKIYATAIGDVVVDGLKVSGTPAAGTLLDFQNTLINNLYNAGVGRLLCSGCQLNNITSSGTASNQLDTSVINNFVINGITSGNMPSQAANGTFSAAQTIGTTNGNYVNCSFGSTLTITSGTNKFSNCRFTGAVTIQASSNEFSNCTFSSTCQIDSTFINNRFTTCQMTGNVTVTGDNNLLSCNRITGTLSVAGTGNVFNGNINAGNVSITNSNNVFDGNAVISTATLTINANGNVVSNTTVNNGAVSLTGNSCKYDLQIYAGATTITGDNNNVNITSEGNITLAAGSNNNKITGYYGSTSSFTNSSGTTDNDINLKQKV